MSFGRLERSGTGRPMSDINMTPLIDVMLVLLVIFIITAPLMAPSLRLDLPQAEGASVGDPAEFVTLAIDAGGALYFGEQPLPPDALAQRLAEAAKANPQLEVQLRADRGVPYGRVAELIGLVQQAGLNRIGFVTEAPAAR
jgi:biopolymer transport protein ExbD/biopolymer transport protein TolR